MKLTKLQRYTAYIIMLEEIGEHFKKSDYWKRGLCWLIYNTFGIDSCGFNGDNDKNGVMCVLKFFPEIKKRIYECYEFSGDVEGLNQRKNILKQCIEETHP